MWKRDIFYLLHQSLSIWLSKVYLNLAISESPRPAAATIHIFVCKCDKTHGSFNTFNIDLFDGIFQLGPHNTQW